MTSHWRSDIAHRLVTPFVMAMLLAAPVTFTACTTRQVYDPYHNDSHRWDRAEERRYEQWETETHRSHMAFDRRSSDEQRAYFDWRHQQP